MNRKKDWCHGDEIFKLISFKEQLVLYFDHVSQDVASRSLNENIGSGNGWYMKGKPMSQAIPVAQRCTADWLCLRRGCSIRMMAGTELLHYSDVIMGAMASRITSLTIVYSPV